MGPGKDANDGRNLKAVEDGSDAVIASVGDQSQLVVETTAMCDYALTSGKDVPPRLVSRLQALLQGVGDGLSEAEVEELAGIHQRFNRIVAPSTPQALVFIRLEKQRSTLMRVLGAVPIMRHVMLATLVFLASFVIVGQSGIVNQENLHVGLPHLQGLEAVCVLMYLISCAGLGACFTSLYRLNQYVSRATYDPRFDSTYWSALILGVIAGVFISELLYDVLFVLEESGSAQSAAAGTVVSMGKPALALLGGFSANMVYKVLQRLVDTIESLFKGDQQAVFEARQTAEMAKLRRMEDDVSSDLARHLSDVERAFDDNPDAAREMLRARIEQLLAKR